MRECLRAAALFLTSCAVGSTAVHAAPITAERAAELRHLVRHDCGSCHGMTLKGGLGPDIRAARLAGIDPATIAAIILDGVPGKPMPPWRSLLSSDEAFWIANYLLRATDQ
ncbi:MAG: cytochrome c [Hyphomicrobiaceae bacterium]